MNRTGRSGKQNYSRAQYVLLKGKEGVVEGERFRVYFGQSLVVGRSASCDISLKRCKKFVASGGKAAQEDKDFRRISREHFRISFSHPRMVELEDLSQNGTFVNGKRIDKLMISDLKQKDYEISFGEKEVLVLSNTEE